MKAPNRAFLVAIGAEGGLATRAAHDPMEYTAKARASFYGTKEMPGPHWFRLVDPENVLPEGERKARALARREQHYRALARSGVEARAKR